ncbi:MAG: tail fiber domain-containing protein [Bacteroidales bacterium]|jgi:hypothetical protein|nr:tail fiber domain-containing protein [Bacteroidales bacterium]
MKTKRYFPSIFFIWCVCTSLLNAQIKVHPNGAVHAGNTSATLFDINTRFEINMSNINNKAVIRGRAAVNLIGQSLDVGFQFIPTTMSSFSGNPNFTPVMALTGLNSRGATIGTLNNQMYVIFSTYYHSNGQYIGILASSDANLKTSIRELSPMRERISRLRPVMYDFVIDGSGKNVSTNLAYQNRVGFIAQEVRELFPDLVATVGEDEILSIDYAGLIPYLTKAIQDQNEIIEHLQQQVTDIQTGAYFANFDIGEPKRSSQQTTTNVVHALHQNIPNPFNSATTITYQLAENATNAKICIYNLTGKQLQCYNLPTTQGENAVEVRASSLQSGMYLYSLIVDGKLIDTKRMILTE